MILQQLFDDAEAILGDDFAPPMYGLKPVRWEVCLQEDGQFISIQSLGGDNDNKRGLPHFVPLPPPRSGQVIKPCLLADSPAYVLGVALEEKEKRAKEKHNAFQTLIQRCASKTSAPSVIAVQTFLSNGTIEPAMLPEKMAAADLVSFRVGEDRPTEHPAVQAFWDNENSLETAGLVATAQCLVTGQHGPIERILQQKINGIPNGNPVGTALLSADKPAFESYGWQQARNSPISRIAAELSTKALNHLIKDEGTNIKIGGLVYVFWTKKEGGDDFFSVALKAPEQVRDKIFGGVFQGKKGSLIESDDFYALALSASGGRAVVRDWINTTVGNAQRSLEKWHQAQEIVDWDGTPGPLVGVQQIIKAAFRDASKEVPPAILGALVRCALHGEPVPRSLLSKAVFRCRAEQNVNRSQAMLIKACLVTDPSNSDLEKEQNSLMSQLNPGESRPAYLYGRLLAELEAIQYAALGQTNATLVDRFYGAASTAPATVFGQLLGNATKAHLPKIRKTRPKAYDPLRQKLEGIILQLDTETPFLSTLTLQQQALFAVGYYHQRADNRKAIQEAKAQKNLDLILPGYDEDFTANNAEENGE